MQEEWAPLQSYPGYSASDMGRVQNDTRGTFITPTKLDSGYPYISLYQGNRQVKRALGRLIAQTFVPQPNAIIVSDTVIHLDGIKDNCQASNLMWRPRWFALAYTRQLQLGMQELPPIINLTTGEVFEDPRDLVVRDGLLLGQIIRSILYQTNVFPTTDRYDWA